MIGTLSSEFLTRRFSGYLQTKGVVHSCDGTFDAQTGDISYQIWVHDEDQLSDALSWFARFQDDSCHAEFQVDPPRPAAAAPPPKDRSLIEKAIFFPVTLVVILICALCFTPRLYLAFQTADENSFTPVDSALLFESPQGNKMPWMGLAPLVWEKFGQPLQPTPQAAPFEQIREGEVWRLITPIFLHGGLIHILFNMLWVWALSRPIEQRIGSLKLILFIILVAIPSNIAQYLVNGPYFIGYSGVVMGYAGFIWMRMRMAPWEGYPVPQSSLVFLFLFVIGLWAFQLLASLSQLAFSMQLSFHIANTAHIVGALTGAGLARLSFFSWRPHHGG